MSGITHLSRRPAAIRAISVLVLVLIPAWTAKRILNPAVRVLGAGPAAPAASSRMASAYGKLPISFEINQGQADRSVQFLARGSGYSLFLAPGEAVLTLHSVQQTGERNTASPRPVLRSGIDKQTSYSASIVRVRLVGASTSASVAGLEPLPGKSNYFIGNDPSKWHTNVPTYAKVRYSGIYPGIDLIYYGNQEGRLEHDFVVGPGADPNAIAMDFSGSADRLFENLDGDLVLQTKSGDLSLERPAVYQMINGRKKTVEAAYKLRGENKVAFKLGDYDKRVPLVIDPVIQYSGVFGGSKDDYAMGIAIDSSRNAYVTGLTYSLDLPLSNPFLNSWSGVGRGTFIAKINAAGTALVYSTYLAGTADPEGTLAFGIAVDNAGRAFVTGFSGQGLPLKNPYQPGFGGNDNTFVTVLNAAGDDLVYSTYLGGQGGSTGYGITVDASGNAYITGGCGGGFPTLHSILPSGNTFVAKFNNVGTLQYSSIVGPVADMLPEAIAVDASGSVYITGFTYTSNLPVTKNAFQSKCPSCGKTYSGFVMKISRSGNSRVYSTYLGGVSPALTDGKAIAVDTAGNAYIAGANQRGGLPISSNAFQKKYGGIEDGFVTKLNPQGTGLIYSTYLGGANVDVIYALALDQYRQAYVLGATGSADFPLKAPLQAYVGSGAQRFVTTLSATGSSIVYYSTYFGKVGGPYDTGGIAVDKALNVYIAGGTVANIPITPGALNKPGKGVDVFVSKLVIMDDLTVGVSASPSPVMHGGDLTYTIAATSKGPDFATNLRVDDVLPAGTTFVSLNAGGGSCTTPAVGGTGKIHCVRQQQEKGQTYTVTLTVHVNAASGTRISNTATAVSNTQDFVPGNNKGTVVTTVN